MVSEKLFLSVVCVIFMLPLTVVTIPVISAIYEDVDKVATATIIIILLIIFASLLAIWLTHKQSLENLRSRIFCILGVALIFSSTMSFF